MEVSGYAVYLDPGDKTWVTTDQSRSGWIEEAESMVPLPEFRILCRSSASLVVIPARTLIKIVINLRFSVKGEKKYGSSATISFLRRILLRDVNGVTARG
jgi:hypothetical protein